MWQEWILWDLLKYGVKDVEKGGFGGYAHDVRLVSVKMHAPFPNPSFRFSQILLYLKYAVVIEAVSLCRWDSHPQRGWLEMSLPPAGYWYHMGTVGGQAHYLGGPWSWQVDSKAVPSRTTCIDFPWGNIWASCGESLLITVPWLWRSLCWEAVARAWEMASMAMFTYYSC